MYPSHSQHADGEGTDALDMSSLTTSLPYVRHQPVDGPYREEAFPNMPANAMFLMQPPVQYQSSQSARYEASVFQAQQQQLRASLYHNGQMPLRLSQQQQPLYGYGLSTPQYSPISPSFNPQMAMGFNAPVQSPSHFTRRSSEPAPVPWYPRGPPRKPKQSGHGQFERYNPSELHTY